MEDGACKAVGFQGAAKQGLNVMFQDMCPPAEADPEFGSGRWTSLAPHKILGVVSKTKV